MPSFVKKLLTLPFAIGLCVGIAATAAGTLGSDLFTDVQRGAYYDEAIGEMYDLGIIKGYDNGRFGPNDYVTRGQIAVMFARFADMNGGGSRPDDEENDEEEEEEASSSAQSSSSSIAAANIPPEGAIRFTAKSFTVNETAGVATVSVVRTNGNAGAVSVDYKILSGSATPGSDYTLTTGTVNFAVRETSKTFTIPIGDDTATEGTESITIQLHNVKGGAILSTPSSAQLNIVDNETTSTSAAGTSASSAGHEVAFNAASYAVAENGGTIAVTLKRSGGTGPVTVNYTLTNGSAVLGSEYSTTNGSVTFEGSDTLKTFPVAVIDDSAIDGNKTLTMALGSPTGGAKLGNPATAVLTIIDNETTAAATGSLKFSSNTYVVSEGESALITVSRVGGTIGTVSVSYSTANGSAQAGSDYTSVSGTLTFLAGESSKTFAVHTFTDGVASEGQETLSLTLSSPTAGAVLMTPSTATLRIDG
ncbi:S-layer homology domain-containing protein [Candidatus Peregrinibacteria bacterium]|nr:S-layer homology domain-containing protein [Candidatus Peregrinibacteria bacterium]